MIVMTILSIIDRLFTLLVCGPPLYVAYRFIRWYIRLGEEPRES